MKKILLFIQCIVLACVMTSCEKEPYKAEDLDFELALRVYDLKYNDIDGVQFQTAAQKAILTLDAGYQFYYYLERPQITIFEGQNYTGCKVETISNIVDNSVKGENYDISFDRKLNVNGEEQILTYRIFYDLDRTVYKRLKYDEDGTPSADANGNPVYESYYKDSYVEITTAAGEVICRNNEIGVLLENRAV